MLSTLCRGIAHTSPGKQVQVFRDIPRAPSGPRALSPLMEQPPLRSKSAEVQMSSLGLAAAPVHFSASPATTEASALEGPPVARCGSPSSSEEYWEEDPIESNCDGVGDQERGAFADWGCEHMQWLRDCLAEPAFREACGLEPGDLALPPPGTRAEEEPLPDSPSIAELLDAVYPKEFVCDGPRPLKIRSMQDACNSPDGDQVMETDASGSALRDVGECLTSATRRALPTLALGYTDDEEETPHELAHRPLGIGGAPRRIPAFPLRLADDTVGGGGRACPRSMGALARMLQEQR